MYVYKQYVLFPIHLQELLLPYTPARYHTSHGALVEAVAERGIMANFRRKDRNSYAHDEEDEDRELPYLKVCEF